METIAKINLDLQRPNYATEVNAMQDDGETRLLEVTLTSGGAPWNIPEGVSPVVVFRRPNYTKGMYDKLADGSPAVTTDGNTVTVVLSRQMLAIPGLVQASLQFEDAQLNQLTTFPFRVNVQANPYGGAQSVQDVVRLQWLEDELGKRAEQIEKAVYQKVNPAVEKAEVAAEEANKAAAAISEKIAGKLDKPTEQPAAGQILKVKSVNTDGSIVVEWANAGSAGGGAVSDVLINGATVVRDGVANVQLSNGLTHNNALGIVTPTPEQISGRNPAMAITGTALDSGVKAAMCDGKGPAWTAGEQAAARDRMGLENLPLVAEATVETPVKKITISNSSDGEPLNLRECMVLVDAGAGTGIITVTAHKDKRYSVVSRINLTLNGSSKTYLGTYTKAFGNGNFVSIGCDMGKTSSEYYAKSVIGDIHTGGGTGDTIKFFELEVFTASEIPAGTKITIYGVKA